MVREISKYGNVFMRGSLCIIILFSKEAEPSICCVPRNFHSAFARQRRFDIPTRFLIVYAQVQQTGVAEVVKRQNPTILSIRLIQARHSRMLLPSLTLLLTTAAFAAAQLVFPNLDHDQLSAVLMDQTHENKPDSQPINYDDFVRAPMLSDVMTLEPQASIFFSYARESAKLSGILSGEAESGDGKKYTVFAPMNRAVMALPRKPYVQRRALQGLS